MDGQDQQRRKKCWVSSGANSDLQLRVECVQAGAGLLEAEGMPTEGLQLLLQVLTVLLGLGQL